jgi:hypothetical protein
MSENLTRPHSEKGVGPARRPIDKAHWRFRIAQQAKMAQHEAETSGYLADVG